MEKNSKIGKLEYKEINKTYKISGRNIRRLIILE
jgi:hypothetical protein